jgi:hypothetical protein
MTTARALPLGVLYERDETAWLELTASLVAEGRLREIDRAALVEYLSDMAKRDKREVTNRLTVLIAHVLKWQYQPKRRTNSWRATILSQQDELEELLESGTLLRYADGILAKCYGKAVQRTAAETGLQVQKFPEACPYSIGGLLSRDISTR